MEHNTERRAEQTKYKLVFISNYINHHQIPFCNAMYELLGDKFLFIQTEPMEQERVQMGWQESTAFAYLRLYYEEPGWCQRWIDECEVAVFGGTDEECYIRTRLQRGEPIVRYSERIYKTGQWKAISPRGLLKKYHDHTKYRKASVYLLCSGAYVPSDFHIVRAYPQKMFCWGYFPETMHYDVDKLLKGKGWMQGQARAEIVTQEAEKTMMETEHEACRNDEEKVPYLLWAARFIDWKHPDLPLRTAHYLKSQGLKFHMDIVGGGELENEVKSLWHELQLEDCVTLVGYQTPAEVRTRMERADIFLQTSDREEGWGAVANEAMNSACALVSNHMIGAVPYLVRQAENGFLYKDGDSQMLYRTVENLVRNAELRRTVGRNAYETITKVWNAENAAKRLMELIEKVVLNQNETAQVSNAQDEMMEKAYLTNASRMDYLAPCVPAPVISERKMWSVLNKR